MPRVDLPSSQFKITFFFNYSSLFQSSRMIFLPKIIIITSAVVSFKKQRWQEWQPGKMNLLSCINYYLRLLSDVYIIRIDKKNIYGLFFNFWALLRILYSNIVTVDILRDKNKNKIRILLFSCALLFVMYNMIQYSFFFEQWVNIT